MKITALTAQKRNAQRVNVLVDGAFRFSLDVNQILSLGIKVGAEYTEDELAELEDEGRFSRVYTRALEYALTRPRSEQEMRDYLYRKTRDTRDKHGNVRPGIAPEMSTRIFDMLVAKSYIDDRRFAEYWVENRFVRKGISSRRLSQELMKKGVTRPLIEEVIGETERDDVDEIRKVAERKARRYSEPQKLKEYLVRQGFSYDDVAQVVEEVFSGEESDT